MKGAETEPIEVTEAKRQGSRREPVAERSRRRGPARRNTNRKRGRARATSVRANAKSKIHQDASSRAGRHGPRVVGLTRGDLRCESAGGVSRGRRREESRGNPEGLKEPEGNYPDHCTGQKNRPEVNRSSSEQRTTERTGAGPA